MGTGSGRSHRFRYTLTSVCLRHYGENLALSSSVIMPQHAQNG